LVGLNFNFPSFLVENSRFKEIASKFLKYNLTIQACGIMNPLIGLIGVFLFALGGAVVFVQLNTSGAGSIENFFAYGIGFFLARWLVPKLKSL
jgi:hypothetical protein